MNKAIKLGVIIISGCIVLILLFNIGEAMYFGSLKSDLPINAIQKYAYSFDKPFSWMSVRINGNYIKINNEYRFNVSGYFDNLGMENNYFFLQRKSNGSWYVIRTATGI